VTSWGVLLIVAFLALGLSGDDRRAYRRAISLIALVVLAVGLGVV
jgi:hypothetical protein